MALTCPHTSHVYKPPLWDTRQNDGHSVSPLQATEVGEHIGSLSGQGAQFFKAPFHLVPFAIHPPQGWVGWSLSCLAMGTWERKQACMTGPPNRWDICHYLPSAPMLVDSGNSTPLCLWGNYSSPTEYSLGEATHQGNCPPTSGWHVTHVGQVRPSLPDFEFSKKN